MFPKISEYFTLFASKILYLYRGIISNITSEATSEGPSQFYNFKK